MLTTKKPGWYSDPNNSIVLKQTKVLILNQWPHLLRYQMSKFSLTIYINAILVHQGKPTFSLGVRKKERCMLAVLAVKEFMNCSWDDSGEREREKVPSKRNNQGKRNNQVTFSRSTYVAANDIILGVFYG